MIFNSEVSFSGRDIDAFEQLVRVVKGGRALALVGAGLSARLGFPSWTQLIDRMHQAVESKSEGKRKVEPGLTQLQDVLWRAQEYRNRLGEDLYRSLLMTIFSAQPAQVDPCIDALVQLPFRSILTTNYDSSLELAHQRIHGKPPLFVNWDHERDVLELMFRFLDDTLERRYVYLHGRYDRPETIVLTDYDYTRRYVSSEASVKKLFALFAMHRVVFFGFSLDDPDLMAVLRQVNAALSYDSDEVRHFAILGIDKDKDREVQRNRLRNKFGVQPIFYDQANDHASLELLMNKLLSSSRSDLPEVAERGLQPAAREIAPSEPSGLKHRDQDPEDPNKNQFGGQPERNGLRLSGTVTPVPGESRWFNVHLEVQSTDPQTPLAGQVDFHLHPTFAMPRRTVQVANGMAVLDLVSYGAFTVGAQASQPQADLELDLASLPDAPEKFRQN